MTPQKSNDEHDHEGRLEDKQRRFEGDLDWVQRLPRPERLSRPLDPEPLNRPRLKPDLKK